MSIKQLRLFLKVFLEKLVYVRIVSYICIVVKGMNPNT